ncbi:MAG TPA: hypothetical protein VFE15_13850 [Marmoricola sp.]|nr:hypothetical protein [Marmoricola sp.]
MRLARFVVPVAVLLATALLTAGCGGSGGGSSRPAAGTEPVPIVPSSTPVTSSPSTATSTPTTPAEPIDKSVDCSRIFSHNAAVALAGEKLGSPTREAFSGLTACRWTSPTTGSWVQVVAVPGAKWVKGIPQAVNAVMSSDLQFEGRNTLKKALALIKSGGKISDVRACSIFSTMVSSLQGAPKGSTRAFNYLPDASEPQAINGQACVDGRYYSVQLTSANLTAGKPLRTRITTALRVATR